MAPTDYVSDWEDLYGAPLPKDGGLTPETKVIEAPKSPKAKPNKTAQVK